MTGWEKEKEFQSKGEGAARERMKRRGKDGIMKSKDLYCI